MSQKTPAFLVIALLAAASLRPQQSITVPAWVRDAQPVKPETVAVSDYPHLADWLAKNARPADDYFIGLFKRHDVVVFGEAHNVREHKEFIINLIPRLYHQAGVRCIGWEFSNPSADAELERLVTAAQPDPAALLNFARSQAAAGWNSKEHWDLIEAVRKLNAGLPRGRDKMRFVGIDITLDWTEMYIKIKTLPKDHPEVMGPFLKRDVVMAENAEKATLAKGVKGLLFVGRGHDQTHVGRPPDPPYSRPIMAKVLYDKYGDRVFQVSADMGTFTVLEKVMESRNHERVGFDLYASPFATILTSEMGKVERPMANFARGYLYFGKCEQLHANTPIQGFVTEEMFEKHRNYYEIDIGRQFGSAKELDEYLQVRRWRIRCPQPR